MGRIAVPVVSENTEPVTIGAEETGIFNVDDVDVEEVGGFSEFTDEEIRLLPIKRHFDIDATDVRHNEKIKGIMQTAKELGVKNRRELFEKIREIETRLGDTMFGGNRVTHVYNYLRLERSAKKSIGQLVAMENAA